MLEGITYKGLEAMRDSGVCSEKNPYWFAKQCLQIYHLKTRIQRRTDILRMGEVEGEKGSSVDLEDEFLTSPMSA